jgi:cytochrome c oxidase subunit 2
LILLVVYGFTLQSLRELSAPEQPVATSIQVIGNMWWWEVRYPDAGVVTANEIHIPAGQPVEIVLSSEDVIHSFWVPELHGKLDALPGRVNSFWIEAEEPGVYWGECAEFCGVQHANMAFVVVAEAPEEYQAWLEAQDAPAPAPASEQVSEGLQVFLNSGCVNCHTIRGTPATGELGPDLTHLASRLTLGAGAAPNTRGHLAGWVADPHGIKPGVMMPPSHLDSEQLQALLTYLESLE